MHDVDVDDMRCRLERGVGLGGIAEAVEAGAIAGRALPDERRAGGQCIVDLGDGRQRIVLDLYELGGVLRLLARLGDHRGDRLADIAHDLVGERAARRHLHTVRDSLSSAKLDFWNAHGTAGIFGFSVRSSVKHYCP